MPKFVVGTVEEIPPGQRKIVDVAGRTVGVFNVGGEFFALLNRCPHQGGPLCTGNTLGFLQSAGVGEFIYSRPGEVVRCPWHGWEYDLRTGQSWFDPARVLVRNYPVSVAPGAEILGAPEAPTHLDAAATDTTAEVATHQMTGTTTDHLAETPTRQATGTTTEQPAETSRPRGSHDAEPSSDTAGPHSPHHAETADGVSGLQKGPYVAETYPVSVEQQYVVVEIGR
jgi:nitrite reductase/ring-hydroxylating ferredoxin subunit